MHNLFDISRCATHSPYLTAVTPHYIILNLPWKVVDVQIFWVCRPYNFISEIGDSLNFLSGCKYTRIMTVPKWDKGPENNEFFLSHDILLLLKVVNSDRWCNAMI